jgi:hypothetical protein
LIGYSESRKATQADHVYLVTNAHVAANEPVARFNKRGDGFSILPLGSDAWVYHKDRDDVAIAPIEFDSTQFDYVVIKHTYLITEDQAKTFRLVGVGDEAFFIGRHIGLSGKRRNTPAVRYGAISMMDAEPILQTKRGRYQESLVVEARSLGGYSGSPVYAYTSSFVGPLKPLFNAPNPPEYEPYDFAVMPTFQAVLCLLGIDWGHMQYPNAVQGPGLNFSPAEQELALNSGMLLVVPAWKITDILMSTEIVALRKERDAQRLAGEGQEAAAVEDDATVENDGDGVSLASLAPEAALRALLSTPRESNEG